MKATLLFCSLTAVLLGVNGCGGAIGKEKEKYREGNLRGGDFLLPKDFLVQELTGYQYLYVGKKRYLGVRGLPPYHLKITNTPSILFVTDWKKKVTFHIVNTNTGDDMQIDGGRSDFGGGIGSPDDCIEKAESDRLILACGMFGVKPGSVEKTTLNLKSKRIDGRELILYGTNGIATNRIFYRGNSTSPAAN